MSGLSLPLPATVERIAASLVPFADAVSMNANEALHTGARGSISTDAEERAEAGRSTGTATLVTRRNDRGGLVPPPGGVAFPMPGAAPLPAGPVAGQPAEGRGRTQPTAGSDPAPPSAPSSPTAEAGPAETTPTEPAPSPAETEPAKPPAESNPDPIAAVTPVVDEVLAPVSPVVEDTTKTVEETIEPVTGILPGLGK